MESATEILNGISGEGGRFAVVLRKHVSGLKHKEGILLSGIINGLVAKIKNE